MSGFPFLKSFRGFQVNRTSDELEFQDVFFDKLITDREVAADHQEQRKLEVPLRPILFWILYAGFAITMLGFLGRTFYLQILAGEDLERKAQENTIRTQPLESNRGVIYDRWGNQLVFNKPSFDFVCDKLDFPPDRFEKEEVLRQVAKTLDISFLDLKKELNNITTPKFLAAENLSHEQLIILETRAEELEGCQVQRNTVRAYVQELNLGHVLGYVAKISPEELREHPDYLVTDQIGKIGLEKAYEKELRGIPGRTLFEKDAGGKVVRKKGEIASEPGRSLVLWLDLNLQRKAREALERTLFRIGAQKGVVVALDPATGGVLALVSLPGFDNNLFSRGINRSKYEQIVGDPLHPLFNRAIAGNYPVGSIIKPLVAAAALQEQIIDPEKELFTKGYIEVPNRYNPDIIYRFNDWKDHGRVDMRKAIAISSNVYFYTIGGGFENQRGLGPTKLKEYLATFGWGLQTGIDLPGEGKGLVPDPDWKKKTKGEGWWDGDTYLLAIGQGNVLATPLQVASSFVPIANGGTLYKPQIVKGTTLETEASFLPFVIRKDFIGKENIAVVREGMRQAVKWGSAVLLNQLPVSSAAKTGTAQTGRKDVQGLDYLYSWVTVFAPYENPEIVLTVLVEDAKEGSLAVLPVAKEVLEWYFTRFTKE